MSHSDNQTSHVAALVPAFEPTTALTKSAVTVEDVTSQYELIVQAMKKVMKDGEHYGTIPGCGTKKTLLKPGAEVLMVLFGLSCDVEVERFAMQNQHREYECKVTVFAPTGRRLGTGVGSCSTMESKYRFRTGPVELTGKRVPNEYWDLRSSDPEKALAAIGGKGYVVKKADDNKWYIAMQGERVENDNPADQYNTVLKLSKKRALIDGILNSTAASYLFTQDLEELLEGDDIFASPETGAATSQTASPEAQEPGSGEPSGGTNAPEQITVALTRKKISFTTDEQTNEIRVKLNFSDADNRKFVQDLGFKWVAAEKSWVFKP